MFNVLTWNLIIGVIDMHTLFFLEFVQMGDTAAIVIYYIWKFGKA